MHSPDFSIPQEVENQLRICPVTEEAVWLNEEGQLLPCEVKHEVVAPEFLPGNAAKLVFFSQQKYVTMRYAPASYGKTSIKLYQTKESAWESACLDAVSELGLSNTQIIIQSIVTQIINKATKLIHSLNWWFI
ncbi:hypothetical protein QUB05_26300 [Microcoleus sp. F10-C6]|uniref:hypothetical protein n=1 Tax=unclassified Microcoleus TaxID=2642155 RepID=UPI002FD2C684